jgi:hypothetical protein
VIVLVSKPPAASVARTVLDAARATGKPVVVNFLGADPAVARDAGLMPATTLEDAARIAVAVARGSLPADSDVDAIDDGLLAAADAAHDALLPGQRVLRGLFSGGTLCSEAGLLLRPLLDAADYSVIDLGDDEYTVGRPHPMIDFRLRNEHLIAAAAESSTAVILLDIVLGYGSHADPASAIIPAVERACQAAHEAGRPLTIVGSVCGTEADPQGLARQEAALRAAGVLLAPSNAQAARLAARVVTGARSPASVAAGVGAGEGQD